MTHGFGFLTYCTNVVRYHRVVAGDKFYPLTKKHRQWFAAVPQLH